jgi:hypothetical protein
MLVRVLGWLALLARSDATMDVEILTAARGRRAAPHQSSVCRTGAGGIRCR